MHLLALKSRLNALESLWFDLKYGVRQLRKSPGFTVAAVLTLGLGIGFNSSIFSVFHQVLAVCPHGHRAHGCHDIGGVASCPACRFYSSNVGSSQRVKSCYLQRRSAAHLVAFIDIVPDWIRAYPVCSRLIG